jgi:hypothetical protein
MIQKGALHNRSTCRNKEGRKGGKLRALNILNLHRKQGAYLKHMHMKSKRGRLSCNRVSSSSLNLFLRDWISCISIQASFTAFWT